MTPPANHRPHGLEDPCRCVRSGARPGGRRSPFSLCCLSSPLLLPKGWPGVLAESLTRLQRQQRPNVVGDPVRCRLRHPGQRRQLPRCQVRAPVGRRQQPPVLQRQPYGRPWRAASAPSRRSAAGRRDVVTEVYPCRHGFCDPGSPHYSAQHGHQAWNSATRFLGLPPVTKGALQLGDPGSTTSIGPQRLGDRLRDSPQAAATVSHSNGCRQSYGVVAGVPLGRACSAQMVLPRAW